MTTHTPEEAQTLWCPMARVAQAGHTDINVSYNRTITKLLVPVRLQAPQDPDDFDLGQEPSQQMDKTLLVRCFDRAWYAYFGAMGDEKDGTKTTVRQFVMWAGSGYTANCLLRGTMASITKQDMERRDTAYLIRIVEAIKRAFEQQQPRMTKDRLARLERLQHANDLIKAISEHGRRFFWSERDKRLARLEMDERGKLWWIDNYRGTRVCVERFGGHEHRWQGFSHGGTLKRLVQMMRDYVKNDTPISSWYIAQDCWGYSPEEAAACREKAISNPAIVPF